jgi:hypothetical protein
MPEFTFGKVIHHSVIFLLSLVHKAFKGKKSTTISGKTEQCKNGLLTAATTRSFGMPTTSGPFLLDEAAPIFSYAPRSTGTNAYADLVNEESESRFLLLLREQTEKQWEKCEQDRQDQESHQATKLHDLNWPCGNAVADLLVGFS